jgi:hypothetical protein
MTADDVMENVKDFGMNEIGKGSEYIVKKIRDMAIVDR